MRDAKKWESISKLPDILILTLKRFQHTHYGSTKISRPVSYPLEELDMLPFMTPGVDASSGTRYRLVSVVNHSGAVGGGHYISYGLHQPSGQWFEHDDSTISQINKSAVRSVQGYVLMYERIADDAVVAARESCTASLAATTIIAAATSSPTIGPNGNAAPKEATDRSAGTASHAGSGVDAGASGISVATVLISRKWLTLFGTCANPGPITNLDFACRHGGVLPHCAEQLADLAVRIPLAMWTRLHDQFGGGESPVLFDKPCSDCCRLHFHLAGRRAKEDKVRAAISFFLLWFFKKRNTPWTFSRNSDFVAASLPSPKDGVVPSVPPSVASLESVGNNLLFVLTHVRARANTGMHIIHQR